MQKKYPLELSKAEVAEAAKKVENICEVKDAKDLVETCNITVPEMEEGKCKIDEYHLGLKNMEKCLEYLSFNKRIEDRMDKFDRTLVKSIRKAYGDFKELFEQTYINIRQWRIQCRILCILAKDYEKDPETFSKYFQDMKEMEQNMRNSPLVDEWKLFSNTCEETMDKLKDFIQEEKEQQQIEEQIIEQQNTQNKLNIQQKMTTTGKVIGAAIGAVIGGLAPPEISLAEALGCALGVGIVGGICGLALGYFFYYMLDQFNCFANPERELRSTILSDQTLREEIDSTEKRLRKIFQFSKQFKLKTHVELVKPGMTIPLFREEFIQQLIDTLEEFDESSGRITKKMLDHMRA